MHDSRPARTEPMRSDTFPYPELYAHGVSPLGPICYFDAGQEGHLPPVVLVHALGLNMTLWEDVAVELARHTRVIGLDLPGCGHSARPRHPYSLQLMSQAVVGLLDHLGIERAVLMGHSYGGRVVTDVALQHPGRVAGLVLMNSSGFTRYPLPLHLLAQALFRPAVVAPLVQAGLNRVLSRIFATRNERTERFVRQIVEHRGESRYAWDFAHYASPMIKDLMGNVLDRLHELTLPALVIWGERDALLRHQDVSGWIGRLPNARLLTIPRCGHMPNLERPDLVSAAVIDFLAAEWGGAEKKVIAR